MPVSNPPRKVFVSIGDPEAPPAYRRRMNAAGNRLLNDLHEVFCLEGICSNQWFYMPSFHNKVYVGTAWIDQGPALYVSNYSTDRGHQGEGHFRRFVEHAQEVCIDMAGAAVIFVNPRDILHPLLTRKGFGTHPQWSWIWYNEP